MTSRETFACPSGELAFFGPSLTSIKEENAQSCHFSCFPSNFTSLTLDDNGRERVEGRRIICNIFENTLNFET